MFKNNKYCKYTCIFNLKDYRNITLVYKYLNYYALTTVKYSYSYIYFYYYNSYTVNLTYLLKIHDIHLNGQVHLPLVHSTTPIWLLGLNKDVCAERKLITSSAIWKDILKNLTSSLILILNRSACRQATNVHIWECMPQLPSFKHEPAWKVYNNLKMYDCKIDNEVSLDVGIYPGDTINCIHMKCRNNKVKMRKVFCISLTCILT